MGLKSNNITLSYDNPAFIRDSADNLKLPISSDKGIKIGSEEIGFISLFRYATTREKLQIIAALFLAAIAGLGMPFIQATFAEMTNAMMERQYPVEDKSTTKLVLLSWFGGGRILSNVTLDERMKALTEDTIAYTIWNLSLNTVLFLTCLGSMYLLKSTALKQTHRIKEKLFFSLMRQDVRWFDVTSVNNFSGKINSDLNVYEKAIGTNLAIIMSMIFNFLTSFYIGFSNGWELTLAIGIIIPFNLMSGYVVTQLGGSHEEIQEFQEAATLSEESFTQIRTVVAFGGETKAAEKYESLLNSKTKKVWKQTLLTAFGVGCAFFGGALSYFITFFYGTRLILRSIEEGNDNYSPTTLVYILFSIWMCCYRLGSTLPLLENFPSAKSTAKSSFKIIEEKPTIDPLSTEGVLLDYFSGRIDFHDVYFNYPSRTEVPVLKGFNLTVRPGELVALVGTSGGGKTTVLQLLQRFYDPIKGYIAVDGIDMKSVNLRWWRNHIGCVGQEAMLFSGTVAENIRLGKLTATQSEIENAARQANAHNFIMKLDQGYSTVIGPGASTLSGGEKQRIAIARAFIRDPKILLLDEPTSALDAESEIIVQSALKSASKGRTTFLVTHRLKTAQSADKIIVLSDGLVAEEGTHEQLLEKKGLYYSMVENENIAAKGLGRNNLEKPADALEIMSKNSKEVEEDDVKYEEEVADISFRTIFTWIRPELSYLILGMLLTLVFSVTLPITSVNYGDLMGALANPDKEEKLKLTDNGSYLALGIAFLSFFIGFAQFTAFSIAGHKLIVRLRCKAFASILKQEIAWFDRSQNHPGRICSRLAQDTSSIHAMTGVGLYTFVQAVCTIIISFSLSIYYSWKLAMVSALAIPMVYFGVFSDSFFMMKDSLKEQEGIEQVAKIALEAINNKRVVTSLGLETYFIEKYNEELKISADQIVKKSVLRGLAFGFAESAPFIGYSICVAYGTYLINMENLHFQNIIKVSELIIFGSWVLAQSSVYTPNFSMVLRAAKRLQFIFERVPKITGGLEDTVPDSYVGDNKIRYSHIAMAYPTRPEALVLNNLSLIIKEGQKVAVVGKSGGGKSSILHLLQRLYNPVKGKIYLHNTNITSLSLSALRYKLGLVSQEPVLLSGTIRSNIEFGDNSRQIPMDEIIEAAKAAHIHDFISSLPDRYDTPIGSRIAQLSGGQKQRLAIARALVRNPSVLLLDEATSALDPESEIVVQEALDAASSNRTTITVAHRLGAVVNADVIFVIDNGCIAEFGTHSDLMSQGGIYSKMHGKE